MNVKKTIKKIVALGSGLAMIGATIMGATADLSSYPEPFIQDGVFSGKIVVGADASTQDVIGAVDISASLQAEAKTGITGSGDTATTTVEGGVLLEDSNNQDLNYGDTVSTSAFDDQDFPVLLADGTVEDDDGTDFNYDQKIIVGNAGLRLNYSLVNNNVYDEPIVYLDIDAITNDILLNYTIDFDSGDELNIVNLDDGESINMFGSVWTFKNIVNGSDVVLYGSDVSTLVSLNTPVDVEVDGETYTLNIVGANAENNEVHVSVNGEVKSMSAGDTKTINGLQVYVQDIFVSTVGGESASANLFIGSKELNFGSNCNTWTTVQLDNEDMDGVEVYMDGTEDSLAKIEFRITPTDIANEETDEDYDWLKLGDTFTDPLFGFNLEFVEVVPDLESTSRDYVELKSSSDDFEVTFTNLDGAEYTFSPYMYNTSSTDNVTWGEDFLFNASTSIAKDSIFILEEDSASSEPKTRIFEFKGSDYSDDEAKFKDLATGNTLTLGRGDTIGDTGVTVTFGDDDLNLSAASKANIYTASGANISFAYSTGNRNSPSYTITVTEDAHGVNSDEVAGDTFTMAVTYDTSDDEINIAKPASWQGDADDDDGGDYYYGVDAYGTYYKQEAQDNTKVELWIPMEDADYRVFLSGPESTIISTGSSNSMYYNVNPIGVGIAVLDVDAPSLGSVPMIVVGGPCANTVAAELMGNPANCVEGFEEGKAVIRYYDDYDAILVAGYSAMDTQGASRVLAEYEDYALTGSEVEVVVPSLSSITVNPVA